MSIATTSSETTALAKSQRRWRWIGMYAQLTKARLSLMVLFTTLVGFVLGATAPLDWSRLAWTLLGTALAAGCANALNQLCEVERDALMKRTAQRPLPSGNMSSMHALVAAVLMGGAGVTLLAALANFQAAALALFTIGLYVLVYTPLKARSTLNTLAGAVAGAVPPVIGWVAAAGRIDPGAWLLALLLFTWQLPHFFALAWLYREDYRRGGFRMLPVIDVDGRLTAKVAVATSMLLIPMGLLAMALGLAGWFFVATATLLGCWMVLRCVQFARERTAPASRRLFIASLIYLPLVLSLLVIDRGPVGP